MLGSLEEINKNTDKAEGLFKKAIELNPNVTNFYLSLGTFYARQKMVDKALKEFNTAFQKNPNSLPVVMSLGILYETQKNYDKAVEYYQKALKINPKFAPAANNLAFRYAEKGEKIDEALNLAQMAKEQFPDDPHIADTLGWVFYKKNIYTRAIVYFKEALEKLKDNPTIHYHLGLAYMKNGDKDQARRELKKALELDPKFSEAEEAKATLDKIRSGS